MRIQTLKKEVKQAYLPDIAEDIMDSGYNPMLTIFRGIIVEVGSLFSCYNGD